LGLALTGDPGTAAVRSSAFGLLVTLTGLDYEPVAGAASAVLLTVEHLLGHSPFQMNLQQYSLYKEKHEIHQGGKRESHIPSSYHGFKSLPMQSIEGMWYTNIFIVLCCMLVTHPTSDKGHHQTSPSTGFSTDIFVYMKAFLFLLMFIFK
jgi:hypothetical protein